jgi:glycosyltransferase involved in cell wall biosynthesis
MLKTDELDIVLEFEGFDSTEAVLFDVGAVMEIAEDEEYCGGLEVDEFRCVVVVSPDIEAVERAVDEFWNGPLRGRFKFRPHFAASNYRRQKGIL